ncbi:hypothetical protein [Porphyromonas macacae]|uniref:Uncharacterized protein n=1 Tax=Porphyromonas macacae TaxID=28115 RepID=A0A379DG16_9PORP|nr:hypothetical protein [Porphyromonas macacae]SUB76947.1 Uncharacterised protein [Porphyromonas macacae]
MTDQERLNLIRLEENIQKLIGLASTLRKDNDLLRQRLADCEEQLRISMKQRTAAETRNEMLLVAGALAGDENGVKYAKSRIDELIKEVDRCISLIKTE